MELLYFILTAYGMTQLIVYGSIFSRVRPSKKWLGGFGDLFHCPMCMGFWVGVFLCGINDCTELFTFEHTLVNYFILGCLSSGTSYILNMLFGDCGIKIQKLEAKDDAH
tara:strand:- start:87 stop:413 length:327 start_codon:yes stop_codon:yes gene_type:complete